MEEVEKGSRKKCGLLEEPFTAFTPHTLRRLYLVAEVGMAASASVPSRGCLGSPGPSCPSGSAALDSAVQHRQGAYCTVGRGAAGASWAL